MYLLILSADMPQGKPSASEPRAAKTGEAAEGTPPPASSACGDREQIEAGRAAASASGHTWQQGLLSPFEHTLPPGWITCRDYTNGGPKFIPDNAFKSTDPVSSGDGTLSECSGSETAYEVLAVYPDRKNGLAAVKCNVGAGVAVLVGTHPELDPIWLLAELEKVPAVDEALKPHSASAPESISNDGGCMQTSARAGECVSVQLDRSDAGLKAGGLGVRSVGGGVSDGSVREQLERSRAERRLFWTMLLQSAGLGSYILGTTKSR